jgi:hypothetical protein
MKKVFSISLIILTFAAILPLSVATHYCGGNIAASKISLSGKVANCGMEADDHDQLPSGIVFSSHCCDNIVVSYSVTSNYFPSFTFIPDTYQQLLQHFDIPDKIALSYPSSLKIFSDKSPPDDFPYHSVDLSEICILRI